MSKEQPAADQKTLTSLETLDRMMKFAVVGTAWQQGQQVYSKVKNSNALFNWTFSTTEGAIKRTTAIAAPLIHKLDGPIKFVDRTVVKGINKLETTAPIIKEAQQQIFQQTKIHVMKTVQPHYDMVCALTAAGQGKVAAIKDISVQKMNVMLATKHGNIAVNRISSTSALAEKVLDYYFPVNEEENVAADDAPISAEENPLMHTIQMIGRLSNKVTRRVYSTVVRQVTVLRKQDVHEYSTALITILRLTYHLNLLGGKGIPMITAAPKK